MVGKHPRTSLCKLILTLLLQDHFPRVGYHVGYHNGPIYQSYNRDLGEAHHDKKVKEVPQYAFDEFKPSHYEHSGQSTLEHQEDNYEIQPKEPQPHQDSLENTQYQSHGAQVGGSDNIEAEEYHFQDFDPKENLFTKEVHEEEVGLNDNLGLLPPYIAAQPRSSSFKPHHRLRHPAFSRYPRKSAANFSSRRNWPHLGFNRYRVSQSLAENIRR